MGVNTASWASSASIPIEKKLDAARPNQACAKLRRASAKSVGLECGLATPNSSLGLENLAGDPKAFEPLRNATIDADDVHDGSDPLPPSYIIARDTAEIMPKSKLLRMDNVGIVVESLDDAISFFTELGLMLEGRAMVEGEWAGRVTGLGNQRVEIAMMVTPDGHSRLELSRFLTPSVVADHRNATVNALGYLRAMFTVSALDETLTRLREHGAQLVGEVVQYADSYRLCYIRGPEGLLIGLAEPLGSNR